MFEVDENVHSEAPKQELWSSARRDSEPRISSSSLDSQTLLSESSPAETDQTAGGGKADIDQPVGRGLSPDAPPMDVVWDPTSKSPIEPGMLDGSKVFELAWGSLLANLGFLVGAHSIALLIGLGLGYIAEQARDSGLVGISIAIQFPLMNAVQWFLLIGLTKITLAVLRGQTVGDFNELFSGGRLYGRVFLYMLAYSVMVSIGLLMIVPGVYLACRFWPGVHFIVDRDVTVNEAFKLSSDYTAGNISSSVVVALYGMLAFAAGILTFNIGFLITYPLYSMLWSVAFLMITRQPIARPTLAPAE